MHGMKKEKKYMWWKSKRKMNSQAREILIMTNKKNKNLNS